MRASSTMVEQSTPTQDVPENGFAEIHDNTGVKLFDISDYMVAAIRGEELPRSAEKPVDTTTTAMGKIATAGMMGWSRVFDRRARKDRKLQKRLEKYEINEDDNRWTKTRKSIGRHAIIAGVAATSLTGAIAFLSAGRSAELAALLAADNIDMTPVTHDFSNVIIAGGAGQGDPTGVIGEMQAKGLHDGYNVEGVYYPAQIGPVVGMESMYNSGAVGTDDMYAKAIDDINAGRPTELIGYSEGSYVALHTANRIIAENGGVKPDNLSVTIIGAPYAQGGILGSNNAFANAAGPILDLIGIPKGEPVPPGTHVVYYDTDFWANSGNQVPTSMLRQLIELAAGGHAIPNPEDPSYTFTDSDGVIHTVYSRNDVILQALMDNAGLYVADTESANRAINDLFPLDGSKPNVAKFQEDLALTLEHQGDPVNVFIGQFIRNLPPEYAILGQSAMDAFNDIAEGAAKIASGDLTGGMNQITGAITNFMNSMNEIMPKPTGVAAQNTQAQVQQLLSSNITGLVQQTTGHNFSAQINGFMNLYQANANGQINVGANSDLANQFVNVVTNHVSATDNSVASSRDIQQTLNNMVNDTLNPSTPFGASVSADASIAGTVPTPANTQPLHDIVNNIFPSQTNGPVPEGITPSSAPVSAPIAPETSAPTLTAPVYNEPVISTPAPAPVTAYEAPVPAPAPTPEPVIEAPTESPFVAPAPAPAPVIDVPAPAPAPVIEVLPAPAPAPIEAPAPAPAPVIDIPAPAPAPAPAPVAPAPNPLADIVTRIFSAPEAPAPRPAPAPAVSAPAPVFSITPATAPTSAATANPFSK